VIPIEHVNGSLVTLNPILCPEILGKNPGVGEISNFDQEVDGGGPWVVVKDLSHYNREKKKYKSHNIRWIMGGRQYRKRKLKIRATQCRQVYSQGEVTHRTIVRVKYSVIKR
jgi:hypothetical protein